MGVTLRRLLIDLPVAFARGGNIRPPFDGKCSGHGVPSSFIANDLKRHELLYHLR